VILPGNPFVDGERKQMKVLKISNKRDRKKEENSK